MARLFGTDGVRGIANKELTCELAYKIGKYAAWVLTSEIHKPRILIGKDTRISGDMLQNAIAAGICSVGAEAIIVGVIPTPGIAYLTRKYNADAGVVISASHNSFEFNGIKWIDRDGLKLNDEVEDKIESLINNNELLPDLPVGENVGRVVSLKNSSELYLEYLISCIDADLSGKKIVLDCANGAASFIAPTLFKMLGATVYPYYNTPDGININNQCGSTYTKRLQQIVVEKGADIGFAFDGDADRMLAVDECGMLIDGDVIMGICAIDKKSMGELKNNVVVTTVMSNIGLERSLDKYDIEIIKTGVGDRYVLEEMLKNDHNLGGEQSGHVIFLDKNTTGDGILTALELIKVLNKSGKRLSDLAKQITIYPQVLVNINVENDKKYDFDKNEAISRQIDLAEKILGNEGRVLVRTSGTEPLVRVMLEGKDDEQINELALSIAKAIEKELNGKIR